MSGIQIFTEQPISTTIKKESESPNPPASPTTSAVHPAVTVSESAPIQETLQEDGLQVEAALGALTLGEIPEQPVTAQSDATDSRRPSATQIEVEESRRPSVPQIEFSEERRPSAAFIPQASPFLSTNPQAQYDKPRSFSPQPSTLPTSERKPKSRSSRPYSDAYMGQSATPNQTESRIQSQPSAPMSAAFAPQASVFLPAEPQINPPTPQAGTFPEQNSSTSDGQSLGVPPPQLMPQRADSLKPGIPGSPRPYQLNSSLAPRGRSMSPRRELPPPPKVGEKLKPLAFYSPAGTPGQTPAYAFPQPTGNTPNTATFAQQQLQYQAGGLLSPHPNFLPSPAPNQVPNEFMASPLQTPNTAVAPSFPQAQPANFEHPPGYVQNPYAADMTPEQRFAASQGTRSPTLGYTAGGYSSPNPFSSFAGTSVRAASVDTGRLGILDGGIDGAGVWGAVSGWAKTAGKRMSSIEGEVWKRLNGDQ